MDNVRYRVAATAMRNKGSSYETPTVVVASRQAPSTGDSENYHPGRRQRSRRRDVYAVPDDFVRVSAMSPPPPDAVRRRLDSSDDHVKSPTSYWAQPAYAADSRTMARSRSRPRPPLLHELGVQRDYGRDSVNSGRLQEQQMTEESRHRQRHRQRQQQQQQHLAPSLIPSVEFAARSAVDSRPQVSANTTSLLPGRTFTSPTPAAVSPSYMNDNKALLKEALISAAAAKLSRSSSARSAVVKPIVVIRNGPAKSSSDERVDDAATTTTTTTTVKSTLSSYRPESSTGADTAEHTADVAIATAAAAAAAATRRSRTHRRDAEPATTSSGVTPVTSAVSGTSQQVGAGTRRTRGEYRDAAAGDGVSHSRVAVSTPSGTKVHDGAGLRRARPVDTAACSPAERSQTLSSSNCVQVGDNQRQRTLLSTPGIAAAGTAQVSGTQDRTPRTGRAVGNDRDDLRPSTNSTPTRDTQPVDKTINDNNNVTEAEMSSPVADAGTLQESPCSTSKVAFIKSLLSRTRSPSPSRCRRSRSKVQQTSASPSSVKRIGAEVAQRIGAPVKGYLKQLRDRSSSQRRRPTEPDTKTTGESEPAACQNRELSGAVGSQPRPNGVSPSTASCDEHTADDASSRGRRFRTDKKKQDNNNSSTSALTSVWKSTSELTTPMSRLDSLLKANSLQHLQAAASTTAAFQTTSGPSVETSGSTRAASSTSAPSAPPLLSKTSQSTGCLLSSADRSLTQHQPTVEHQRTTTAMTRCYLEKPPRAARRAMTVQLDRRPVDQPSLGTSERQSTSQADLRNLQPSVDEAPANDVNKQSPAERITSSTSSASRRLHATSSQNERDLRELYEQKRLERQLEEKLALMEKERAGVIAKLWSQIDHQNSTTQYRTTPISDHSQNSTSTSRLVLPLSDDATSPTDSNSQVVDDPLGDLLIELSSTSTSTRWSERRRAGRSTTAALRPRAASCSRRLTSDTHAAAAADAAAALTAKSLSHTHLYRKPSNASDLSQTDSSSSHVRHRSHQQLLQPAAARPLTCYLPVRDRDVDLRRFIETSGHRLDQCDHVQLTTTTCHGYLSKLSAGAAVRQWKRRWFVFDRAQRCLQYYTDKTEKRSDGAFVWFQTIQDVFVDHERRSRSPHPESTFCVKTVERSLFLIAPTPEAMRIWIDVIFTGAEGYRQFLDS